MRHEPQADEELVTVHAILRWLERVDGYDMPALRQAARRDGLADPANEGHLVVWLRHRSSIDIDGVVAKLTPAKVREALAVRATSVRMGAFVFVLGNGRVVTVKPATQRRMRPLQHGARRRAPSRRDRRVLDAAE